MGGSGKSRKELVREYRERTQIGGVYGIRNKSTGKTLLQTALDIDKAPNQFEFSKITGSCVHPYLADDWVKYGAGGFELEILETLEKKETQTPEEFREDIRALESLWREKIGEKTLY
jgi:hypothetical protein